jgi:transcriptional regulator with XRE-family HTH domain
MGGIDMEIGRRLRMLRWSRGMTMEEVAREVGVRYQQIQKYETGANRLSANRLLVFARLFGIPVGSLFEGLDLAAGHRAPEIAIDRRGFALACEFEKLSEPQKVAVLSLVRSMSDPPETAGRRDGP